MHDPDKEMMDYIDKYIVRGRHSDAADDSAGAAWAAYQRGDFSVPDWFAEEYRTGKSSAPVSQFNRSERVSPILTLDSFLKSMGILFIALIIIFLLYWIFS